MVCCKNCRFLIIEQQPIYPLGSVNLYFCAAAVEDKEYMSEFKKKTEGISANYISRNLLENSAPDWCPILRGFEEK